MICQMSPRMRCSLPSEISDDPMLTTEHPIPLAEVMTILLFSVIWNAFRGLRVVEILRTRVSIVSGTESLMSLQRIKPSRHSSKSCIVSVGIGKRVPTSESFSMTCGLCEGVDESDRRKRVRTPLMWFVNSFRSSSLMVWLTLAFEPLTVTLPALVGKTEALVCVLSLTLS